MKKNKLQLKKTVIASLSNEQKAKIIGGGDDTDYNGYTTSHMACTGVFCCDPDTKATACRSATCTDNTCDSECTTIAIPRCSFIC